MIALTTAAALSLIAAQQCVSPSVAPIIVGIAQHESGLRPYAIHDNVAHKSYFPETAEQAVVMARSLIAIGHSSLDLGVGQVNTSNMGWTGLTLERAFDPCRNFTAAAAVLFARYNGSPPDGVKATYAAATAARIAVIDGTTPAGVAAQPCPEPDPTGWHIAAQPHGCADDNADWHITKEFRR